MKIIITQTKQVNPYEPRKIQVEFDTENEIGDWTVRALNVVEELDKILYPENYVEFHQDPPSEIKEPDEF